MLAALNTLCLMVLLCLHRARRWAEQHQHVDFFLTLMDVEGCLCAQELSEKGSSSTNRQETQKHC